MIRLRYRRSLPRTLLYTLAAVLVIGGVCAAPLLRFWSLVAVGAGVGLYKQARADKGRGQSW